MYWTPVVPPEQPGASRSTPWEYPETNVCGICSEQPVRFGLLENCSHTFCLSCIRLWRRQREQQDRINLRKCPICRVESFLILPASSALSGEAKEEAMTSYKLSMGKTPCKWLPTCPFGSSCLYRHDILTPTPLPTVLRGADRRKHKTSGVTLADFFLS